MSTKKTGVSNFERELAALLNSYSAENRSNTPDFILANFMLRCLNAFDAGVSDRDRWYGVNLQPGVSAAAPPKPEGKEE